MLDRDNRKGIIAGGNWIIDHLKRIDLYPQENALANIKDESYSNGGSAYNVLKDLSKLGAPFPLLGIGLIGEDDFGDQIMQDCNSLGIDAGFLKKKSGLKTSYTDVMTVEATGLRTFFHYRGANAFLAEDHFIFSKRNAKLFHLGYLLLLDSLDKIYEDGTSGASRVLENAGQSGLKTSVDLVSEDSNRYKKVVTPALPFIDYLFLNEFEATKYTGINVLGDNSKYKLLDKAATKILAWGVRSWVFIHFPNGVFAKSHDGDVIFLGSLVIPEKKIIGVVGAGDAFASGVLLGIHENWDMKEAIELGICCAATCLQEESCSDGILPFRECLKLKDLYSFRELTYN